MTEAKTRRRGTAIAVTAAALLPALYYFEVIVGSEVLFGGEILYMHYPSLSFVFRALAAGHGFPEWAPGVAAGVPLAGSIEFSLFYPLNWLLYPLAERHLYYGLNLLTVAHFCLASSLTALLARRWKASPAAAVAAGAVYSLNGFVGDGVTQLMTLETICWLPLLLLLTDRIVSERRLSLAAAAGACGGVSLLGGMTQYAMCGVLICGGYGMARCIQDRGLGAKIFGHRAALLLAGAALASGLFAAQLLPTLELLGKTQRSEMSYEYALGPAEESTTAPGLLGLAVPSALGDREHQEAVRGSFHNIYVGLLVLCLAVLAGALRLPRARFLWAVVLLGLGVAMGRHLPLFYLLYHSGLPGMNLLKDPNRYIFLITLPLALLAAGGIDALARRARTAGFWRLGAVRATTAFWAGLWSMALLAGLYYHAAAPQTLDRTSVSIELVLGLFLPVAAALFCLRAPLASRLRLTSGAAVCLLVLVELVLVRPRTDELLPRASFERWLAMDGALPELRSRLPADQRYYSDRPALTWNMALKHGLHGAPAKGALLPERYLTLTGLGRTPTPRDHFNFTEYLASPTISRLAGVCCAVSDGPRPTWLGAQFDAGEPVHGLTLFRQPGAYGPLRLASRAIPAATPDEALAAVLAPGFDPGTQVVLEGQGASAKRGAAGASAPGRLELVRWLPDTLSAQVDLRQPAYLVHHQSHHPGWRVSIDDRDAELLRADFAFQAVHMPAGRHRVSFVFRSPAMRQGLIVAGVSLACMIVLLGLPRLRARR